MKNKIGIVFITSLEPDFYLKKIFYPVADKLNRTVYDVHYVYYSNTAVSSQNKSGNSYLTISDEATLIRYLIDNNIEIAHTYTEDKLTYLVDKANVKRIIQHMCNDYYQNDTFTYPVDCICAHKESVLEKIKAKYPHKYVFVLKDGIDLINHSPDTKDSSIREKLGIAPSEIVIGFSGKISRLTYFDKLIEVFKSLSTTYPHIKFFIYTDKDNLKFEQMYENLSTDIFFIKDPADLCCFSSNIDIAIIKPGTYFDPYGNIIYKNEKEYNYMLIEAMAYALPFITVRKRAEKQQNSLIENKTNCFTVELDDMDAYLSGLKTLIDNEHLRLSFGQKSRQIVKDNADSMHVAFEYERLYGYLLSDQFSFDYPNTRQNKEDYFLGNAIDIRNIDLNNKKTLIVRSGNKQKTDMVIKCLVNTYPDIKLSVLCHKKNYEEINALKGVRKIYRYSKTDSFCAKKMKLLIHRINLIRFDYIFFIFNNLVDIEPYKNIEEIINVSQCKNEKIISNGELFFRYPKIEKQDVNLPENDTFLNKTLDTTKDYILSTSWEKNISKLPYCDIFKIQKYGEVFKTCNKILYFGDKTMPIVGLFADEIKDKQIISIDIVEKTHIDLIADICDLHMIDDNSIDGIICYAILEHVYNPFKAVSELHRVLKPGGKIITFLPWLWQYHGYKDQMLDFYRFSKDGVRYLFKDFSYLEFCPIRGPIESVCVCVLNFVKMKTKFHRVFSYLIRKLEMTNDKDPSAFNIFAIK